MRQKHELLLLITSCVPGCGEMYQGYMKRGMSILTIFCGIFALAVFLEIGALAVLMLPVWLFSFFDSYNLRAQAEADAAPPDGYLFGLSDVDSRQMSAVLQKRHSLVGWGLVAVGVYIFYSTVADWVVDFFCQFFDAWWLDRILTYDVPRLAVTVGIIALGVWFIRGPKREKSEDIPVFTPPEAEPVREESADAVAEEQEDCHGDD